MGFFDFRKNKAIPNELKYDEANGMEHRRPLFGYLDGIPDEFKNPFTSSTTTTYINTLSNIYANRYSWESPLIPRYFRDLIETYLMSYGSCAIIREYRIKKLTTGKEIKIYNSFYTVHKYNTTVKDIRNNTPREIVISHPYLRGGVNTYKKDEFIIIKDFNSFMNIDQYKPAYAIILDFAEQLSRIDAVKEHQLYKHSLPLLVTGKIEKSNVVKTYFKEMYRKALYMFDGGGVENKFEIENPKIDYILDKLQQEKESKMQEFCALLGISNSQNYSEVYQNIESVKLNTSFVYNVAKSHYINRLKNTNNYLADRIGLKLVLNSNKYPELDLIKPDEEML